MDLPVYCTPEAALDLALLGWLPEGCWIVLRGPSCEDSIPAVDPQVLGDWRGKLQTP